MLELFLSFIREHKLVRPEDRILLTVSGGIDSMVMADLFLRAGYRFSVAHCNFRLRGKEADADEALVRGFAGAHDAPFFVRRFNTEQFARKSGISIQMAARQLRNEWFESLVDSEDFAVYAVAHHLNDSLETFLFNLAKGTGIAGLHGIRPKNGPVIRPLMFATRGMIEAYARENALKWREDRSNASLRYHRNRIRHQVVPAMRAINPNLERTFATTLERITAVEDIFRAHIETFRKLAVGEKGSEIRIDIQKITGSPGAAAVLYELIRPFNFSYKQAESIVRGLPGRPGRLFYSSTHVLNIDRRYLIISPVQSQDNEAGLEIGTGVQEVVYGNLRLSFGVIPAEDITITGERSTALLDYDKLQFPLLVRRWRHGDFFIPLGMRGKKKLSDFMIDEKIAVNLKKDVLVLTSGDQIAWVVNLRIDDRFKLTAGTGRVLKIMSSSDV